MKRKITWKGRMALGAAILGFVFCCGQAMKEDVLKKEDTLVQSVGLESNLYVDVNGLVKSPEDTELEVCSLSSMTPIIAQLKRRDLTRKEIEKCLQAVIYVESRYLGINTPPVLTVGDYNESGYDDIENRILFSEKEAYDDYMAYIIKAIHLAYHAYQFEQVELYTEIAGLNNDYTKLKVLEDARFWSEEIEVFNGCADNRQDYWIEKDSVLYARSSAVEYFAAIEDYWGDDPSEPRDDVSSVL